MIWASDYGMLNIPSDIYKSTVWVHDEETGQILEAASVPENWKFFRWLHESEINNGKQVNEHVSIT